MEALVVYLLSFICGLITIAYIYFSWNFNYWSKRGVKFVRPIPFFGNYFESAIGKTSVAENITKLCNEFPNERAIGAYQGRRPALIVKDPELIKDVLARDFWFFCDRVETVNHFGESNPMDLNLFAVPGDKWKVLRSNITPIFSSGKMKKMFQLMIECVNELNNYMDEYIMKISNQVNVHDFMSRFTMEVIGSCVFGLQMNVINQDTNEFRKYGLRNFRGSKSLAFKSFMKNSDPQLYGLFSKSFRDDVVTGFFLNITKKIIEQRLNSHSDRPDFINALLKFKEAGFMEGERVDYTGKTETVKLAVDDGLIAAQSFVFFNAGFETSSTALTLTLYELAKNPDIQKRLQDEVDEALEKTNGSITYEMCDLEYMNMVLNETMRKYPAVGCIPRMTVGPYKFRDMDLTIDKGVSIQIPVDHIHHDPKYYPDPYKFDPERFASKNKESRPAYTYLPFGEGPRICVGMRFGKIQTAAGLIAVMKQFTVEPCSETTDNITFNPLSTIVSVLNVPVILRFIKRQK